MLGLFSAGRYLESGLTRHENGQVSGLRQQVWTPCVARHNTVHGKIV
jgi:hypothetical protein